MKQTHGFTHTHCLWLQRIRSIHLFPPCSSTNSEEAKSTTWLHPVTGEAVITGHRKTQGKQSENVLFLIPCKTHVHAQHLVKVVHASRREKGRQVAEGTAKANEGRIVLCSKATAPLRSPLVFLYWRTMTPPSQPGHFLKVPSRRRQAAYFR